MNSHKTKQSFWIIVSSLLIVSTAGVVISAHSEKQEAYRGTPQQPGRLAPQSTLMLINSNVKSISTTPPQGEIQKGETLGEVKDVIFDNDTDTVYCVVVHAEGKYYPVPWEAFNTRCMYTGGERAGESTWEWLPGIENPLCLDLTRDQFKQAPSVSSIDIDLLSDRAMRQRVIDFYSERGLIHQAGTGILRRLYSLRPQANLIKASDLIDMHVQNDQHKKFAEIEDLVIDAHNGTLAYALVDYGGVAGLGEDRAAVPWTAFSLDMTKKVAMLEATEETLNATKIKDNNLQPLTDPEFAQKVHQTYEAAPYWEVFAFVPATPAEWTAPWQPDSAYNRNFKPSTMTTVEGTIRNVGAFRPQKNSALGLRLSIKTTDGRSVLVYAGPRIYAMHQGMEFKVGDKVTVNGSKTQVDGKPVIMATEVTAEGKTLRLRDSAGKPLWTLSGQEGMSQ